MKQTKEQHREYMRQWRAKHKPVEPIQLKDNPQPVKQEPKYPDSQCIRGSVADIVESKPEINIEVMQGKSDFRTKRKILIKFVRFDLFHPSNREECLKVRLSKLGLFHEDKDRLEEHFELCEGCRDWFGTWSEGTEEYPTLTSYEGLNVFLAYRKDFPTEKSFWAKLLEVNGKIVTIDRKLEKITVVVDPNEPNPNKPQYSKPSLDLRDFQLWNNEPKEKSPSLSEDVKYQQELTRQEPESKPEPSSDTSSEQPPQPPKKSNNPSYEEWSRDHS